MRSPPTSWTRRGSSTTRTTPIGKSAPCSAPEQANPYTSRRCPRGLCSRSPLSERLRCIFVPDRRLASHTFRSERDGPDCAPRLSGAPCSWRSAAGWRRERRNNTQAEKDDCVLRGDRRPGCWSHARRRFVEAARTGDKIGLAALRMIGPLFLVERQSALDGDNAAQRLARRTEQSAPAVERLRVWLEDKRATVPPRTPLGPRSATSIASGSVSCSSFAMGTSS